MSLMNDVLVLIVVVVVVVYDGDVRTDNSHSLTTYIQNIFERMITATMHVHRLHVQGNVLRTSTFWIFR